MSQPRRRAKPKQGSQTFLPEHLIARLWRNRDPRRNLTTTEGRPIRVLYPGRSNGGPGPDFKDALLQMTDGSPLRGDVEVHTQSAGWRQHGHNRDPGYNSVVLHVVDARSPATSAEPNETKTQQGRTVPTVGLAGEVDPAPGADASVGTPAVPVDTGGLARLRDLSPDDLLALLRYAGEERFRQKSSVFLRTMSRVGPEEALYRGIMEALGYSRNRGPFLALAKGVPWGTLRGIASHGDALTNARALEATLLWAAGLGTASMTPPEALAGGDGSVPLPADMWCTAGIRPQNHPGRRLHGAAVLFARCLDAGLLALFRKSAGQGKATVARDLLVTREHQTTLIGKDRALDITVNVVLPLLHALGGLEANPGLEELALAAYYRAPKLGDNEVLREMKDLLGLSKDSEPGGTLTQQGLLHLYQGLLNEGTTLEYAARTTGRIIKEGAEMYPGYSTLCPEQKEAA